MCEIFPMVHSTNDRKIQLCYYVNTMCLFTNLKLYIFHASILHTQYLILTCCTLFLFINYCSDMYKVFIHSWNTRYLKLIPGKIH
jgi:hypothetical protein